MASKRNPAKRPRPGRRPIVALIMGSTSDWETMRHAAETLDALGIPYERRVMSAHRTPRLMFTYATAAAARGLRVVIGGAGGAAHLPGMMAALTTIPVLGVPVESASLKGIDRKSTRLNSSHLGISYAVFCLKKKSSEERWKINVSRARFYGHWRGKSALYLFFFLKEGAPPIFYLFPPHTPFLF